MEKILKNSKYESIFSIIGLSFGIILACILGISISMNDCYYMGTDLSDVYVGTWSSDNIENPLSITLNSDHTGYIKTTEIIYNFTWTSTLIPNKINILITSEPISFNIDLENKILYFFRNYYSEAIPLYKNSIEIE